jgi:VWFA-related protein
MIGKTAGLLASGFWLPVLLSPGQGQVATIPPDQATVRVATRLVEVVVVAETRAGEPVADLKLEDFSLSDGEQAEPISVFVAGKPKESDTKPLPLPAGTFSNRFHWSGPASSGVTTVILFDGLNTRIQDQPYVRMQIQKFLSQLKPESRVGLYVMGRGPRVLQEVTGDVSALNKALADYHGEPSARLDIPLYDMDMSAAVHFDAWLGELTFGLVDYFDRDRALRTVRLLESIANHLYRLPGRKNLIWVSGSFPDWILVNSASWKMKPGSAKTNLKREIERAIRALGNANIAIYPVDARGLISPQEYNADRDTIRLQSGWPDTVNFRNMRAWAERTGGLAFYNTNDLQGALHQASDDRQASYLLGYYPSHKSWNGGFRRIRVGVARPDVQLRYRSGYFAQPEVPADTGYRQALLDAAMWNPIDATQLGLTVQFSGSRPAMACRLDIDPVDIAFQAGGEFHECGLDVWLVQFGLKDAYLNTTGHTANLRLRQSEYKSALETGAVSLTVPLNLLPEAVLVRILVRDIRSGALGSISSPIKRIGSR